MNLSLQQQRLFDFVSKKHEGIVRIYNDEPFAEYLLRIATIAARYSTADMVIEIALCHTLLDKTDCTKQDLALELINLGYGLFERSQVLKGVYDLTPPVPSEGEKTADSNITILELEKLKYMLPFAQTVKYAEIIDSLAYMRLFKPEAVDAYIVKVHVYIHEINEGNSALYADCIKALL